MVRPQKITIFACGNEKQSIMKLQDLISVLAPISVVGNTDVEITNIQFDSRKVTVGSLFVATVGTAVDGHDFIPQAIAQGACAIIAQDKGQRTKDEGLNATVVTVKDSAEALGFLACQFYGQPSRHLTLVGVTGTNGKTTIATLLYKLTRAMGYRTGLLSTVCNYIDDQAVPATHTTPDALALNALLADMVSAGCEYAFMEVSSHAIAQHRIAGLQFRGGIFTNLTRDHIDFHKTFDNYRDTKKHFFDCLPKGTFAVTNKDDKNGLIITQNTKADVRTYSTRALADYRAQILEEGFEGMLLSINNTEVNVPLVGRFNVSNLLAIYGAALCLGFEKDEVLRILSMLTPVNGRFETIRSPKGWTAIVDYAHTPDALQNVIDTINEIRKAPLLSPHGGKTPCGSEAVQVSPLHGGTEGGLITVVGCGGNRDKGKRPMMAKIAKAGSTQVILTSDNPRHEDPQAILNDMLEGLTPEERLSTLVIIDRQAAIQTACTLARKNDVILVAGKGHEDYQIIGDTKHHFDDHEVVRLYI